MRVAGPVCSHSRCFPAFSRLVALLLIALVWAMPGKVGAVPYASGLSNFENTIYFYLNQPAQRVWLVHEIHIGYVTNDLGPLPAGQHTYTDPTYSWFFRVIVSNREPAGFVAPLTNNQTVGLQISADTNVLLRFSNPAGIAVDTHPLSPAFGRIYVANSQARALWPAAWSGARFRNSW